MDWDLIKLLTSIGVVVVPALVVLGWKIGKLEQKTEHLDKMHAEVLDLTKAVEYMKGNMNIK